MLTVVEWLAVAGKGEVKCEGECGACVGNLTFRLTTPGGLNSCQSYILVLPELIKGCVSSRKGSCRAKTLAEGPGSEAPWGAAVALVGSSLTRSAT